MDPEVVGQSLSTLGKGMGPSLIAKAEELGVEIPTDLGDATAAITPSQVIPFLRHIAARLFPQLRNVPNEAR